MQDFELNSSVSHSLPFKCNYVFEASFRILGLQHTRTPSQYPHFDFPKGLLSSFKSPLLWAWYDAVVKDTNWVVYKCFPYSEPSYQDAFFRGILPKGSLSESFFGSIEVLIMIRDISRKV